MTVRLAAHNKAPTVYFLREFVEAGGLLSYGPDIVNGYRQARIYTGQILGGASPATISGWVALLLPNQGDDVRIRLHIITD